MPNDNIQRIIKRAEGGDKTEYEGNHLRGLRPRRHRRYGQTLTDNRNRTAANMRHYFDKFGGNLGQMGCVGFMFTQKGVVVDLEDKDPDELMMDAGAPVPMTSMQARRPLRSPPAPRTSPLSARHSSRRATSLFLPMWHRCPPPPPR